MRKPPFGPRVLLDLHVHTRRGSECAELMDPSALPAAMDAYGLDGVVITEHNMLWPWAEIAQLNHGLTGRRVYGGVEVSSSTHHYVVIGLHSLDGIHKGISAELLRRITRSRHAAMILVHPLNGTDTLCGHDGLVELTVTPDAVEQASSVTHGTDEAKITAWGQKNGIPLVAGSDAHCIENLGQTATAFPHLPANEQELAFMIQSGLGRPVRQHHGGRNRFPC